MESLSPEWRNVLLEAGIKGPLLALRGQSVTPPAGVILRAFELCSFPPKVVLLGQDPYPRGANGLSFACDSAATPPSLKNIFTCLRTQKLAPISGALTSGLVGWAEQGVLLLNYALTTRPTVSGAHTDIWAQFTRALLEALAGLDSPPVFILLGEFAQRAADNLLVMKFEWGHPSPLNRANQRPGEKHFSNCDCFTLANEALVFAGQTPINWASTDGDSQTVDRPAGGAALCGPFDVVATGAPPKTFPSGPVRVFTDGAASKNGRPGCRASWAFFCADANYSEVGLVTETPSNNRGELTAIERALEWAATVPGADTHTNISLAATSADSCSTPITLDAAGDGTRAEISAHNGAPDPAGEKGSLGTAVSTGVASCRPVIVYSDSMYCINTITSFYPKWVQTGATADKKNLDILARIAALLAARTGAPVEFVHVRSHKKEPTKGTREHWLWAGNDTADKLCTQHLADTEGAD